MPLLPYQRAAARAYAHRWAHRRNPAYYDYEALGGDCTNFASQCIFAGAPWMNYTPTFGWYYRNANDKAPAWTGVEYLYRFLLRKDRTAGPVAQETEVLAQLQAGDLVQLSFDGAAWQHSPVVVQAGQTAQTLLLAAHSEDADYRPLANYSYVKYRGLHILGAYTPY